MKLLILSIALALAVVSTKASADPNNYPSLNEIADSNHLTGDFNWRNVSQLKIGTGPIQAEMILGQPGYEYSRWEDYRTVMWNDGTHLVIIDLHRDSIEYVRTLGF